jgi:hypothetical protein
MCHVHPRGEGSLYLGSLTGFLLQLNVAGNVEFRFLALGGGVDLQPVFTTQDQLLQNRFVNVFSQTTYARKGEYQGIRWRFVTLILKG